MGGFWQASCVGSNSDLSLLWRQMVENDEYMEREDPNVRLSVARVHTWQLLLCGGEAEPVGLGDS